VIDLRGRCRSTRRSLFADLLLYDQKTSRTDAVKLQNRHFLVPCLARELAAVHVDFLELDLAKLTPCLLAGDPIHRGDANGVSVFASRKMNSGRRDPMESSARNPSYFSSKATPDSRTARGAARAALACNGFNRKRCAKRCSYKLANYERWDLSRIVATQVRRCRCERCGRRFRSGAPNRPGSQSLEPFHDSLVVR